MITIVLLSFDTTWHFILNIYGNYSTLAPPLMGLIVSVLPHVSLQLIVYPTGLAHVPRSGLQGHRGGAVRRQLKEKRVRIVPQLLHQPFLVK